MDIAVVRPGEDLDPFFAEHTDKPCRLSLHPEHRACGRPATYGIEFVDLDHEVAHKTEICAGHTPGYLRSIAAAAWCVCVQDHRSCHYGRVVLKNLL